MCRLPKSRLRRTLPNNKADECGEQREALPGEQLSEASLVMQAGVRQLARRSARCAVEGSSDRRTSSQSSRRQSQLVHKCSSNPAKPRPHTTSKWTPSSEHSLRVWTLADTPLNDVLGLGPDGLPTELLRATLA